MKLFKDLLDEITEAFIFNSKDVNAGKLLFARRTRGRPTKDSQVKSTCIS